MLVAPDHKFAAIFLSRCTVGTGIVDHVEIAPGVRVSTSLGVDLQKHWRDWLGSLAVSEMTGDGLLLYVTASSRTPGVLDDENIALVREVNQVFTGLLL